MPWGDSNWYVSVSESDVEDGDEIRAERDGRLLRIPDPKLRIATKLWVSCGEQHTEDYAKLMKPKAPIFAGVLRYLRQANSFCPFAPWVAQSCGYHVRIVAQSPNNLRAMSARLVPQIMVDFFGQSTRVTANGQENDPTTIVHAFTGAPAGDSAAYTPELGAFIAYEAEAWRPHFHAMGLMLSEMYPDHPDPHGDRRYRSEIPLLICHRMHKEDIVFMRAPGRIEKYQQFFGNQP